MSKEPQTPKEDYSQNKIIKGLNSLGDRIKTFLHLKTIKDKELAETVNSNLIDIESAVDKTVEAIKSKNNDDVVSAVKELITTFKQKELSVNVEAPIVNVPDPKVQIIKDNSETEKVVALLKNLISKQSDSTFISNSSPSEAIPVVLTDKTRKKFYDAVMQAIATTSASLPLDGGIVKTGDFFKLVPKVFDEIALTYVISGDDGEGEIETATYKSGGVTVAILTISYNSDNNIANVIRT